MTVILRQNQSGRPFEVLTPDDLLTGVGAQRYSWCSDRIDGADVAQDDLNMAPFVIPETDYVGNGPANQRFSAQRILRADGVAAKFIGGLVTLFNTGGGADPTAAGAITVYMRVGALAQITPAGEGPPMAPEVARLVIPAATLATLTGNDVAAVQLSNWLKPGGAAGPLDPAATFAVSGGDQFVGVSVDKPATTNMADLNIYVDWGLV